MEHIQVTIEQACEAFKNPTNPELQRQAEQVLLQFRNSQRPIPACQHILQHSQSVEARFHAACTIREALIREWASLLPEDVQQLRTYLLQYSMHHAEEPTSGVVRSVCVNTIAVILKRGWLDLSQPQRDQFFHELQAACAGGAGPTAAVQQLCLQLMEALISEFSMASASALGLPWEYHDTCRAQVELQYLQGLFSHALQSAAAASQLAAAGDGPAGNVAAAAMRLMSSVLGWEFKGAHSSALSSSSAAAAAAAEASRRAGPESSTVKPGQAWSDLLLAPATTDWLLQLLPSLRGRAAGTPLAVAARQLLIGFCSLAGEVFPKAAAAAGGAAGGALPPSPQAVTHVARMLRGVLPWAWPSEDAVRLGFSSGEEEVVDAARALLALCTVHKPGVLAAAGAAAVHDAAAAGVPGPPHMFVALEQLTSSCLSAGGVSLTSASEQWVVDVTDMLLECWSELLQPLGGYSMTVVTPPGEALECGSRVFGKLVEAALADAAAGAHDDSLEGGMGEVGQTDWMVRAASLARARPLAAFPALAELISSKQQQLAGIVSSGGDPSEILEQLVWLAYMAAHSLADEGAGETPMVPEWVAAAADGSEQGAAAVQRLSEAMLSLLGLCLQPEGAPLCSPRLLEAACWCAARWMDTYLFPDEELEFPAALQQAYGGGGVAGRGGAVLELLVRCCSQCLTGYPGEVDLHGQVCYRLLPALVRRPQVCSYLLQLEPWRALLHAFASGNAHLSQQLPQKQQRILARCLVAATVGCADEAAAEQYLQQLLGRTAGQVVELAGQPPAQLAALSQRAEVQTQVCCLLEVLRGSARASISMCQPTLLRLFLGLLQPLLVLHSAFKAQHPVVALLLRLADDIVAYQLDVVTPQQLQQVLGWVVMLLQQYRDSNLWQVSLQTAKLLQQEEQLEQCRDLRAVLSLLNHLTQLDAAAAATSSSQDASSNSHSNGSRSGVQPPQLNSRQAQKEALGAEVTRLVLLGLHIVLPMITLELLKFPKLSQLYYQLLSHLLEGHAAAVVSLERPQFSALMSSVEWGLDGNDPVACHCSLEGLAGLAKYQYRAVQSQQPGLSRQDPPGGPTVIAHFQQRVLQRLLLQDVTTDVAELAADALLPLLLAEPGHYPGLVHALLTATAAAREGDDQRAVGVVQSELQKLGNWLSVLLQEAAADPAKKHPLRRAALQDFRKHVTQLVADVHGLIRVR